MTAPAHNAATSPPESAASSATAVRWRLGLLVLLLLWTVTWALSHGYSGIQHDGQLYTLQALAHLQPQSLSQDVFLRFGSQDRYTLFSPLYAAVIGWFGTDTASESLTFILQLAFVASALVLALRLVSPTPALFGVSVLIAIPGAYGAFRAFSVMEAFVTPRMAAEALVLCGLAMALSARPKLAVALTALAMLLHPVMAAAGFAALACLYGAIPRPRLTAVASVVAVIALVTISLALPFGPFSRFDAQWLQLVRLRNPYLFLGNWAPADWLRTIVILTTLLVGVGTLPVGRARTLCSVTLITGVCGLALTLIACDLLQLVRFTQLQPWRWMWLATVTAALLLPAITLAGWQTGFAGRATVLLLASAWILGNDPLALYVAAAAIASMVVTRRLGASTARLLFYGTCGLLVIAVTARMGWNSLLLESLYLDPSLPGWMRKAASFTADGTIPVAVALLTMWLVSRPRGTPGLVVLLVLATAACICLLPPTWSRWTHRQFPAAVVARFAPWRELIPPGSEVLWPESPLQAAVLLERPDFLSKLQTTGVVFSREAAMEMWRRALALGAIVTPAGFFEFDGAGMTLGPSSAQLERACGTGEFSFVVTGTRLSWPALAEVPKDVWHTSNGLRLYRCADRRDPGTSHG
jgi:hypothetical protein